MTQGRPGIGRTIAMVLLGVDPPRHPIPASRAGGPPAGGYARAFALATLACGLTTFAASGLLRVFDLSNVVMLFLLTVVFVALRLGRVAGAWASLLCVGLLDFFFVEPRLSFAVSDTQYIFTFGLMLAVALVISQLAVRLRSEAEVATAGERRASAVARLARDLSGASRVEQIAAICRATIAPLFGARVALLLPDGSERLVATPESGDFADASVAQWAYDHVRPAGLGTPALHGAEALYLPLKAPMAPRGVLALRPVAGPLPDGPDDRRLLDACCSSIALALERIHFVAVAQDTLLRMEGERLRNAVLAAVSHDLKTPLTAIRGLAETLEHPGSVPVAEQRELASAIRQQAEALQRLVTNLLDLARMQSEGVHLNKEWHLVSEVVGSALARSATILGPHPVRTALPADLPLVELDAVLFERVLVNLFDNAAKYAGPAAAIMIRAGASGGWMELFVEDDGPGLPAGRAESLFEPFARGDRESAITGVGLGLALCRSIVAAHGGTIRAAPRLPRGASFAIRLPLGRPPVIESETPA
jgi:two-component system sensor histidine kinase KdpD